MLREHRNEHKTLFNIIILNYFPVIRIYLYHSKVSFIILKYNQKKGFNQMMSILMLGLISAGGGVGVATFSQDQQSGLTQTTGGAGLREAVTIENLELDPDSDTSNVTIVLRNTGVVEVTIGAIYMNGTNISLTNIIANGVSGDTIIDPGEVASLTFDAGKLEAGTVQTFKVATEGGGVITTTATVSQ